MLRRTARRGVAHAFELPDGFIEERMLQDESPLGRIARHAVLRSCPARSSRLILSRSFGSSLEPGLGVPRVGHAGARNSQSHASQLIRLAPSSTVLSTRPPRTPRNAQRHSVARLSLFPD